MLRSVLVKGKTDGNGKVMERRMNGNIHVRCGAGEKQEIVSNAYLSLLVGTMDKWNNAKKAEEHDRVKHGLTGNN